MRFHHDVRRLAPHVQVTAECLAVLLTQSLISVAARFEHLSHKAQLLRSTSKSKSSVGRVTGDGYSVTPGPYLEDDRIDTVRVQFDEQRGQFRGQHGMVGNRLVVR